MKEDGKNKVINFPFVRRTLAGWDVAETGTRLDCSQSLLSLVEQPALVTQVSRGENGDRERDTGTARSSATDAFRISSCPSNGKFGFVRWQRTAVRFFWRISYFLSDCDAFFQGKEKRDMAFEVSSIYPFKSLTHWTLWLCYQLVSAIPLFMIWLVSRDFTLLFTRAL